VECVRSTAAPAPLSRQVAPPLCTEGP
jgi:hypothetical protein